MTWQHKDLFLQTSTRGFLSTLMWLLYICQPLVSKETKTIYFGAGLLDGSDAVGGGGGPLLSSSSKYVLSSRVRSSGM